MLDFNPEVVHSFKLKGHRKSVLCLASNKTADESLIWSGSEDATCRLFDLRSHRRTAVVGIMAEAPVLSIVADTERYHVYVAAEDAVLVYDVRQKNQPLIRNGRSVLKAEDEINQILLRCDMFSVGDMIIAGDDAGNIYTVDVCMPNTSDVKPRQSVLVHDSLSMVTSIACITPPDEAPILISGGTDCSIIAWQHEERVSSIHVQNTSSNLNQICNPPMVHTMALLPNVEEDDVYRILAGFGDHSLGIISLSKSQKQFEWVSRIEEVPADAVATCTNRIGSAGGGTIAVWEESQVDGSLQQRLAIHHAPKVNAIEWGDTNDSTIFVADITNDITCFKAHL